PDKRKAESVAARAHIPAVFASLDQLLNASVAKGLHAIDICTPTDTHRPIALQAMENGLDVLVEKPIARTAKEARDMVASAEANKRKLMVGMNNRFRPDTMMLKTFIDKKELGKIYYIKSGWLKQQSSTSPWHQQKDRSGGGVILDLGIAMLDLGLWLLDYPEVHTVSASTYHLHTKAVEDSAAIFLRLAGDITFTTEVSWTFQREGDFYYCNVFGSEGSAFINPLKVMKRVHGSLINLTPAKQQTPVALYKKSYENELRYFVNMIKGIVPVVSSGHESAKRMAVVEAVYQSAAKKKEIVLAKK
ncbi:MAG TPA: Gfo/Idh/MocA family oxidoreductase, partial [Candidatus Kapabacteria bacterium]